MMASVGGVMVPTWAKWLGLAFGLALLVWAATWANKRFFINPAVNAETSRWNLRWADRDRADMQAAINAQKARNDLERKNQDAIDKLQSDAQVEADRLRADRAAADAESGRLRKAVSTAIARLQAGRDTGTTHGGQTGASTSNLLSQLFAEIDAAAGDYAAEAGRARAAGLRCEAAYDAVRANHAAAAAP